MFQCDSACWLFFLSIMSLNALATLLEAFQYFFFADTHTHTRTNTYTHTQHTQTWRHCLTPALGWKYGWHYQLSVACLHTCGLWLPLHVTGQFAGYGQLFLFVANQPLLHHFVLSSIYIWDAPVIARGVWLRYIATKAWLGYCHMAALAAQTTKTSKLMFFCFFLYMIWHLYRTSFVCYPWLLHFICVHLALTCIY